MPTLFPDPGTVFTRRQFMGGSLALASMAACVPSFIADSATAADLQPAAAPGKERVLVIVQLSGGNDGLNTVIPHGERAYYLARPKLAIPEKQVLPIGDGIGFHPALRPLHELAQAGVLTTALGVGYPNPNRSHFASMDIWHAGTTLDRHTPGAEGATAGAHRGRGWIGRGFDAQWKGMLPKGAGLTSVAFGVEAPLALRGSQHQPVVFDHPETFGWRPAEANATLAAPYAALADEPLISDGSAAGQAAAMVRRVALDALAAGKALRSADKLPTTEAFPESTLGRQLKMAANGIKAELPTRVWYTFQGGYDTHAGQLARHQNLLADLAAALAAFHYEMAATGHADRVTVLVFSEFGRRVAENASGGTDHGAAGPCFILGPKPMRTVLGTHPSLADRDLADGDLRYTLDFRSLYGDLLGNWLGLPTDTVLGKGWGGKKK